MDEEKKMEVEEPPPHSWQPQVWLWTQRGEDQPKYYPVPQNWVPPAGLTAAAMWRLWWFGNERERIGPYHKIQLTDVPRTEGQTKYQCRARLRWNAVQRVMRALHDRCDRLPADTPWTPERADALFATAFGRLMTEIDLRDVGEGKREPSRSDTLSVITLAKKIAKKTSRKRKADSQ
jgi:hypothetical protein